MRSLTRKLSLGYLQTSLTGPNFLLVVSAVMLGAAIANGMWAFAFTSLMLPLVLLWPVQMSLGLFALLLPFDSVATLGERSGTTFTWVAGAASGLILIGTGIVQDRLERPSRAALWWSLFIFWSSASVLWALEPDRVLQRLPTAFGLLLLYLVTVSFRMNRTEFNWVLGLAMAGGIAGAAYAAWQFFSGGGAPVSRASIGETNPNQFALSMLLPLSIATGAFLSARSWIHKMAMLAGIGIIGFGILISMSRGSLIAAVALISVYVRRFRFNWRIAAVVAVIALLLVAVPNRFFERIEQSAADRGAGRFDVWLAGLEASKHHSIIGVGLDNFPAAFDRYAGHTTVFRGYRRASHNVYLGTLTEVGIIGLLLFLIAIGVQIHGVEKLQATTKQAPLVVACEAAWFGILLAGLSKDILWDKVFWFSWVLLASVTRLCWRDRS